MIPTGPLHPTVRLPQAELRGRLRDWAEATFSDEQVRWCCERAVGYVRRKRGEWCGEACEAAAILDMARWLHGLDREIDPVEVYRRVTAATYPEEP